MRDYKESINKPSSSQDIVIYREGPGWIYSTREGYLFIVKSRAGSHYTGLETPHLTNCLPSHPGSNPLRPEATHKLQPRAAHREVAHNVPEEGGELEDGRDEGEEGAVQLNERNVSQYLSENALV
jgi:hypothetical protein